MQLLKFGRSIVYLNMFTNLFPFLILRFMKNPNILLFLSNRLFKYESSRLQILREYYEVLPKTFGRSGSVSEFLSKRLTGWDFSLIQICYVESHCCHWIFCTKSVNTSDEHKQDIYFLSFVLGNVTGISKPPAYIDSSGSIALQWKGW